MERLVEELESKGLYQHCVLCNVVSLYRRCKLWVALCSILCAAY